MPRLLFKKTGNAAWISHLDLMRLFQRAFKRAGLHLTHTQGYNPRPSVSIALPLSVGVESHCELLDFDLDGDSVELDEICLRLNRALVDGVQVLDVYETGRKLRDLVLLRSKISMEYDMGVHQGTEAGLLSLFARPALTVMKRTKNGVQEVDLIPMIRDINVVRIGDNELELEVLACCQNPTLNPAQIVNAIQAYAPELAPDFTRIQRMEIYDTQECVFR